MGSGKMVVELPSVEISESLQIPQLHGCWLCGDDLGSLQKFWEASNSPSAAMIFALRSFPLLLALPWPASWYLAAQQLYFHSCYLYPPRIRCLVKEVPQGGIQLCSFGQHIVQFVLA